MFGAEFGAQSPDVNVDGSGSAEEVIPPDLLQQLSSREHPAGVLRQILQQFEFFVRQIQWAAPQSGRIGSLIDDEFAQADIAQALLIGQSTPPAHQEAQSGVNLCRAGARQENIVDTPVVVHRDQAALIDHGDDWHRRTGGPQQPTQAPGGRQIMACIHQGDVGRSGVKQRGDLARHAAHGVRQQRQ